MADDLFSGVEHRVLSLRRRSDIVVAEHVYRDERYWLVKDPLELQFYRLNEAEYAIFELLDGTRSLTEIREIFQRRFSPQRVTIRELQTFVLDLQRKSLLQGGGFNQGHALYLQAREKTAQKFRQQLSDVLAVKWRGIDPDRFLEWLLPRFGWIFSKPMVALSGLIAGWACLLLALRYDMFSQKMPSATEVLGSGNLVMLGLLVMITKVVHELAHGLVFKRFGGECHEIGVMFLMFFPTLYCSTTDSWLLKSKWQRAGIAAAGMYVELLLAALATLGWWYSEPGTFQQICFGLMTVCSLSVVVLNGNPFLKFDGYYILSDLLEIPNLKERSALYWRDLFLRHAMGIEQDGEQLTAGATKRILATYGLGAKAFRIIIIAAIMILLVNRLRPFGLDSIGLALGLSVLLTLVIGPLWALGKYFREPGKLQQAKFSSLARTAAVVLAVAVFITAVPLPTHVRCPVVVQPRDTANVFARHEGYIDTVHVVPNQSVSPGDLLITLRNTDVELTVARLQSQVAELEAEKKLLDRDYKHPTRSARLAEINGSLLTLRASLNEHNAIRNDLLVRAPRAGRVIPVFATPDTKERDEELGSRDGTVLRPENRLATIRKGELICRIGDPFRPEVLLVIPQSEIEFVREGQPVAVLLDSLAELEFEGIIERISREDAEDLPPGVTAIFGGSESLRPDQPAPVYFLAKVSLEDFSLPLSDGIRGTARIQTQPQTALQRSTRWFRKTFRLKL